ncbi:MAG: alpha-hydroxy-acid oxidizing enzyme [Firmicutes bacterium HGW-Firmicutes-19]|nr:MAG: alpha-hydroxy-acid oxidizing enzyme [Firmicutes bacterium HGW-Firmicutes-19]
MVTLEEVKLTAKNNMSICKMCRVCNGETCRGWTPGPGGKGSGSSFVRNVAMLKQVTLNMRVLRQDAEVDSSFDFFATKLSAPIMAAPIANVKINYGSSVDEKSYLNALGHGCKQVGLLAFLGDGANREAFEMPLNLHKELFESTVMTIKPWLLDQVFSKMSEVKECQPKAIAMDVDAAGLILLKQMGVPAAYKTVEDLKKIKDFAQVPLIVKGVMTLEDAQAALDANVDAIVVSNHGGRVLDDCASTVEVLEEIAVFVNKRCKVYVDGGFRSGADVFKALALGADAVLIGRPFSHMAIGGLQEGVAMYANKLIEEFRECMRMTGCITLEDIRRNCVNVNF